MKKIIIVLTILLLITLGYLVHCMNQLNNIKRIVGLNQTEELIEETLEQRITSLRELELTRDGLFVERNKLNELKFLDTEKIPPALYRQYMANFQNNRTTGDNTRTILFDWPEIITAMVQTYGVTTDNWNDLAFWSDKAIIVYPVNYGTTGDPNGNSKNQTSAVIQLAKKDTSTPEPDDWEAILPSDMKLFNFGDLKPPKNVIVP